jgi:hypothetical protein
MSGHERIDCISDKAIGIYYKKGKRLRGTWKKSENEPRYLISHVFWLPGQIETVLPMSVEYELKYVIYAFCEGRK